MSPWWEGALLSHRSPQLQPLFRDGAGPWHFDVEAIKAEPAPGRERNEMEITDERLAALQPYVGRVGVYIEGLRFTIARVAEVSVDEERMSAVMEAVPEFPLICHYGEEPPRFEEGPHPIGDRWEISRMWEWFYLSEDYWDGSPYLGFRMLFMPDVVEQFLRRDLSWIEELF